MPLSRGVLDTTLCDKNCQLLANKQTMFCENVYVSFDHFFVEKESFIVWFLWFLFNAFHSST
jgi:hypothetical protein